jgi:hypothetical protein
MLVTEDQAKIILESLTVTNENVETEKEIIREIYDLYPELAEDYMDTLTYIQELMEEQGKEEEDAGWVTFDPVEKSRTYYYSKGGEYMLENVHKLKVSSSGNHRLETADGLKYIIAAGWDVIQIEVDEWTI